jgi:uncharacterized beta-barrel protein YwiB (DUF1934 family)
MAKVLCVYNTSNCCLSMNEIERSIPMKDNVLISISGSHIYENYTEDLLEMVTPGIYQVKDGVYTITYCETELNNSGSYTTTLTIDPNRKVTVVREGEISSHMIFEQGQKHLIYYDTEFGSMTIGVSANRIDAKLSENGGEIEIVYSIEIDQAVASDNILKLNVRKTKPYTLS